VASPVAVPTTRSPLPLTVTRYTHRKLDQYGQRPGIDRASFGITTVIKIDCGDFGAGQHESDAIT
jgi:hypothetical protein